MSSPAGWREGCEGVRLQSQRGKSLTKGLATQMVYPYVVELSKEWPDVLFAKIMGDASNETRALMKAWGVRAVPEFCSSWTRSWPTPTQVPTRRSCWRRSLSTPRRPRRWFDQTLVAVLEFRERQAAVRTQLRSYDVGAQNISSVPEIIGTRAAWHFLCLAGNSVGNTQMMDDSFYQK